MKKTDFLKLATIAVLSTGLMAGCASDSTEDPAPSASSSSTSSSSATSGQTGPSPAAKNAIYSAKIKLARAKKLGYEWRDTSALIKAAEKAAAAGDNDKAIKLANQASEESQDAIKQYYAESNRYEKTHGSVEAGGTESDSMASMDSGDSYTVVSGDNLWDISAKDTVYGNPYQWPLIYKANSDKIVDADLIYPGQVFSITVPNSVEIDRAVTHAKTRGAWSIGDVEESDKEYLAQ